MAFRAPLLIVFVAAGVMGAGCGGDGSHATAERATSDELRVSTDGWSTEFSRHSVPLGEFLSGGPPRDGIPPIDEPRPVPIAAADRWLADREPVLAVEIAGRARAYPVQILVWHEIVNDSLSGREIAVTYCPLCKSSLVFDRRVDRVGLLRFGTTGNPRHSDFVMWDDRTESWWQQLTGEAVVGELTGTLEVLPSQTLAWVDFKAARPGADVLSRDTGHDLEYGANPYEGYDDPGSDPFLLEDDPDRRLPPKERVVAIRDGRGAVVVPFSRLAREPVAHVEADGVPVVVLRARRAVPARRGGDRALARRRDGRNVRPAPRRAHLDVRDRGERPLPRPPDRVELGRDRAGDRRPARRAPSAAGGQRPAVLVRPRRLPAGRAHRRRMNAMAAAARPAWHPVAHGRERLAPVTAGTDREADLVARACAGDRGAFEQLVQMHADRLYAVALRLSGDRHEAEEIVQETFLRAWRSMRRFEGRSRFFTWLYRIGVNEALRRVERRRAQPRSAPLADAAGEIPDERQAPQARAEAHELHAALGRAIAALPLEQRLPLVLRDVEGLSTSEAAAVMELGEAAFKSRLHRARLAVRAAVEDLVAEERDT